MNDQDIPPLDDDVRAFVRRAAKVDPAPAGARARVLDRVERLVGPPGRGGGGGRPGTPSGGAAGGSLGARLRLARRLLPLAASFALGGGAVAVAMHKAPSAEAPSIVYVDRPEATPLAAERGAATPPLAPAEVSSPANPPETPRPSEQAGALPPSPRDQLTAERRLLDLARGALEREEPEGALEATRRHERRFPNGALVQEREAMAVRALVLLGRTSEARARANRFRASFPQSLLLPTIESTVGTAHRP